MPPQGCCGLPLQSNGAFEPAREYVRALVARLAPYAREGHMIVANSTSCGLMLKREAREILGMDDDDLALVGSRTSTSASSCATCSRASCAPTCAPLPMRVPYHQPCQGRGHGFGKPALDLLELIPELEVIETDRECCGVAGTYGLKVEKYPIAMEVGAPLFADIAAAPGRLHRLRLRDLPLAHREGDRDPERAPARAPAPRRTARPTLHGPLRAQGARDAARTAPRLRARARADRERVEAGRLRPRGDLHEQEADHRALAPGQLVLRARRPCAGGRTWPRRGAPGGGFSRVRPDAGGLLELEPPDALRRRDPREEVRVAEDRRPCVPAHGEGRVRARDPVARISRAISLRGCTPRGGSWSLSLSNAGARTT